MTSLTVDSWSGRQAFWAQESIKVSIALVSVLELHKYALDIVFICEISYYKNVSSDKCWKSK